MAVTLLSRNFLYIFQHVLPPDQDTLSSLQLNTSSSHEVISSSQRLPHDQFRSTCIPLPHTSRFSFKVAPTEYASALIPVAWFFPLFFLSSPRRLLGYYYYHYYFPDVYRDGYIFDQSTSFCTHFMTYLSDSMCINGATIKCVL